MNKKYLALTIALIALNGCKDNKSIDNLPQKSWQFIETSEYQNTPIYNWHFDSDVVKTGDNKTAHLAIPTHQFSLIDFESGMTPDDKAFIKEFNISFPARTIDVSAIDDKTAVFNSTVDFSQIKLNLPEKITKVIKDISFDGKLTSTTEVNLDAQQYNKYDAKSDLIHINVAVNDADNNNAASFKIAMMNTQNNYVIDRKGATTNITGNATVGEFTEDVDQKTNGASVTQHISMKNRTSSVNWQDLSTSLIDTAHFNECTTTLLKSISQSDKTQGVKAGNCYLALINSGTLGSLAIDTSTPDYLQTINITTADQKSGTISFGTKDANAKFNLIEKDGLISSSFSGHLNKMDITYDISKLTIPQQYVTIIENYLPTSVDIGYHFSNLKRSSLKTLTDISNKTQVNSFDVSGLELGADLKYTTKDGFVSANFSYTIPDSMTIEKLQESAEPELAKGLHLVVQIKNLEALSAPLQELIPQAAMGVMMIKGLGKADPKDPAILTFDIMVGDNLKPIINGKPLAY